MNKNVVNLHFQVDEEPLCGCATSKSLFIYLSQTNHKETTQFLSNELTKKGSHHTEKKKKKKGGKNKKKVDVSISSLCNSEPSKLKFLS